MSNPVKKQILVIDDDAMNREVMEAFLSLENYEVLLARNGEDGLQSALDNLPDAIVLDIRMPDMSGYEVCERLKEQDATKSIPVMIVSGFDAKEDFERGVEVGAEEFLTRPFDADDLLSKVRKLVTS